MNLPKEITDKSGMLEYTKNKLFVMHSLFFYKKEKQSGGTTLLFFENKKC